MISFSPDEIFRLVAWFIALIELVVAFYVLALNARHPANRHVSVFLLLSAVSTFALGQMSAATDAAQAAWPTALLAAVTPTLNPWILLLTVLLLKTDWLRGRGRWLKWGVYGVTCLAGLLTLMDIGLGTRLWYTGLEAQLYKGGVAPLSLYTMGSLALPIKVATIYALLPVTGALALYVALRDKTAARSTRLLAWVLLIAEGVVFVIQFGMRSVAVSGINSLATSATFAIAYGYAGFQHMISEQRLQSGRLQTRLTALVLTLSVPLLIAVAVLLSNLAGKQLNTVTDQQLGLINSALKGNVETWLDLNVQTLQELVTLPDIVSMDASRQKPVLQTVAKAHPYMYLVMTINLNGLNVARNDDAALTNYGDRKYFIGAKSGTVTPEVIVSRTTGRPALVIASPIKDSSGKIVGVGAIASELDDISIQVSASKVGETGIAYVVDTSNRIVAHPQSATLMKDNQLVDASQFPPVMALRQGKIGYLPYTDQGVRWHAWVEKLERSLVANDWGIIVQQQDSELQSRLQGFQRVSLGVILVGVLLLALLVWIALRQALQPIGTLTQTTAAIAAGDLDRTAPIESEDELGALARSFNSMTDQLRGMIGSLEQRVVGRTADLKRRSDYLAASAEVGRAASSILDSDQLIRQAVELIRERFELYYVGLFLVDETGQWAVLRAGTGSAGQAMLARGHRLAVGESSMIGWSISHAQARIALEARQDAVRLATAELPDTRSEAALPLRSRGRILGALTVQSAQPQAFDQDTVVVLQTMADQVAIALDNARLFAESQSALEATRRTSGELSREGWTRLLSAQPSTGYRSTFAGAATVEEIWPLEAERAFQEEQTIRPSHTGHDTKLPLAIPIKVRGNVIGVIDTFKSGQGEVWTPEEIAMAETLADQLGAALESARLFEDTRHRAAREQLIGEVTTQIRSTLDLETVLETALDEIHRAMGLDQVSIHLATREDSAASPDQGRG